MPDKLCHTARHDTEHQHPLHAPWALKITDNVAVSGFLAKGEGTKRRGMWEGRQTTTATSCWLVAKKQQLAISTWPLALSKKQNLVRREFRE
jgi:hypothetical protein